MLNVSVDAASMLYVTVLSPASIVGVQMLPDVFSGTVIDSVGLFQVGATSLSSVMMIVNVNVSLPAAFVAVTITVYVVGPVS